MKKFLAFVLSASMVLALAACGGSSSNGTAPATSGAASSSPATSTPAAPAEKITFTMPTGSMGGSYYSSGTAMAQVLNGHVDGMDMSVSASNTQDNIATLISGETKIAMSGGADYNSVMEAMPAEDDTICSMGVFNQTVSMIVVSGKSDYQSLADLKGKKIQMGSSGSGQCLMNMALIDELGMSTDDFNCEYMSQSDGTQAFTEGKVEANLITSGVPSGLLTQIAAADPDFRILTWDEDFLNKMVEDYPYYKVCTVEPDKLGCSSITEPVKMVAFYGEVLVRADVDEELVYNMCKALYENHDELVEAYGGCAFMTPEHTVEFTCFNLHPGAVRYFQEIGVM